MELLQITSKNLTPVHVHSYAPHTWCTFAHARTKRRAHAENALLARGSRRQGKCLSHLRRLRCPSLWVVVMSHTQKRWNPVHPGPNKNLGIHHYLVTQKVGTNRLVRTGRCLRLGGPSLAKSSNLGIQPSHSEMPQ